MEEKEQMASTMDNDSANDTVENNTAPIVDLNRPAFKPNRKQKRKFLAELKKMRKHVVYHEIFKKELENKMEKRKRRKEIAKTSKAANRI